MSVKPDNKASAYQRIDATPNARMLQSLRQTGYNMETALSDVIDNSIDAKATKIDVILELGQEQAERAILIADNGHGMLEPTLIEAMKMGADGKRSIKTDLGKYGLGMKLATLSYAQRLTVMTKHAKGPLLVAVLDTDFVMREGWFIEMREASTTQAELFAKHVKKTGTLIIGDKIDQINDRTAKDLPAKLLSHFGRVFHMFLEKNVFQLTIQGKKVEPRTPLCLYHPTTNEVYQPIKQYVSEDERTVAFPYISSSGEEKTALITMSFVMLPFFDTEINKKLGRSIAKSGIYVYRNNREIVAHTTLGLYGGTNHEYGFRGIISIVAEDADEIFNIEFTKRRAEITNEEVIKMLRPYVKGLFSQYSYDQRAIEASKNVEVTEEAEENIVKGINSRSNFFAPVTGEPEDDEPKTVVFTPDPEGKDKKAAKPAAGKSKPKVVDKQIMALQFAANSPNDPMFKSSLSLNRQKVTVTINTAHTFYRNIYSTGSDATKSALLHLIYSLCRSEHEFISLDEDNREPMEEFTLNMSRFMNYLLPS